MSQYVYILYSEEINRFYIGETKDLAVRLTFHHDSPPEKFTGKAKDWKLFYKTECEDKKQALAIEKHIKAMKSKKYIQNLKKYPEIMLKLKKKFSR